MKAIETAEPIAKALVEVCSATHENDRSATGFLPPQEFERVADEWFVNPTVSAPGWEKAAEGLRRIVAEAENVLRRYDYQTAALRIKLSNEWRVIGRKALDTRLGCRSF